MQEWFASCEGERSKYLASILEAAIVRFRTVPPPDPAITAYREQLWKLANTEFPALGLAKPRPTREYWVLQRYDDMQIRYKMYSNVRDGFHRSVVDMEFPGRAADLEQLKAQYASELSELGASVVRAGASAAFRIEVPLAKPPEFDAEVTRSALRQWETLLNWWKSRSTAQSSS